MAPVLEATGLRKSFGGVVAVGDVSLAVNAGELLALIGPNGAGKTTCFNLINGQLRPDAGRVTLDGADLTGLAPRAIWRKGVGRVSLGTTSSTAGLSAIRQASLTSTIQFSSFSSQPSRPLPAWCSSATSGCRFMRSSVSAKPVCTHTMSPASTSTRSASSMRISAS